MKLKLSIALAAAGLCTPLFAADDIEALKKELQELRSKTEQLERKVQQLESADAVNAPQSDAHHPARGHHDHGAFSMAGESGHLHISLNGLMSAGGSTASDIGALNSGAHDPQVRGFTLQALELILDGEIEDVFHGFGAIDFHMDSEGETGVELEEAYLETMSLPGSLQIRAGHFYTPFGLHNPTHPHSWAFVDAPLVNARLLGPEGLSNPGAQLSWRPELGIGAAEFALAIQNSQGETAHAFRNSHEGEAFLGRLHNDRRVKSFDDLLLAPRISSTFNLSDHQTMKAGLSGAFAPNGSGGGARSEVYGAHLGWERRLQTPHDAHDHDHAHNHDHAHEEARWAPRLFWQGEAMLRRYEAGAFSEDLDGNGLLDPSDADMDGDGLLDFAPAERLTDYGFYTQLGYAFHERWIAALRFDYVAPTGLGRYEDPLIFGRDANRSERWRISPNLTWLPTEFSRVRLQYNYDNRRFIGVDHSVWVQLEFLLGTHEAHEH